MKNNINFLLFLALSLLFFGCEQTVFINQNGYEPRVAVESDLLVDSVAKLYLTETQNYYGYVDYQTPAKYIEDAKVVLTSNGVSDELTPTLGKIDTLTIFKGYNPNTQEYVYDTIYTKQKYYRGHNILKKGQSYQLKITYQGKEVTSELNIPDLVFAKPEVEQKEELITQGGWSYKDNFVEVRIKDAVSVPNFYRTVIQYAYMQYQYSYNQFTGEYEIVDSFFTSTKFISPISSDEGYEGGIVKMQNRPSIYSSSPVDTGYVKMLIQIESLDAASGKYWQSLYDQAGTNGNPFTEPVILYSNITNGVGFFGASQIIDTLTFTYKKKYQ